MNLRRLLLVAAWAACCLTPALHAQERAKPKPGEGVSVFLQRLGYTSPEARKEFLKINKGKLTRDGGLMLGYSYLLPSGKKSGKGKASGRKTELDVPLFGAAYRHVAVGSRELEGACLYLVSGHGGPDPGAIGKEGGHELHEDEYAYDVILRLARELMKHGAKVHVIIRDGEDGIRDDRYLSNSKRETCLGEEIPLNQGDRLRQRINAINRLARKDKGKYKRAVFIHVESREKEEEVDVFSYHAPDSKSGKRLAENIYKTFKDEYAKHQPGRGFSGKVTPRSLSVLTKSTPVATFLELGNIQNEHDRKRLVEAYNRQALAEWICRGIIRDFKGK